jgi:spore germination protein KC
MIKKISFLIICLLLLTGCWDRIELNELGIILAVAIDKNETTGEIELTSQFVRPSALGENQITKIPTELVTETGETVFDAIRNTYDEFDRTSYFAHTKVIIVSDTLAKEGLMDYIDFAFRSQQIRRTVYLIVAKECKAKDILSTEHGIETIQATYITNILKKTQYIPFTTVGNLLDFYQNLTTQGINPICTVGRIVSEPIYQIEDKNATEDKGVQFRGTAVFKKDKLIGYLDNYETRGLNFLLNKIESGIINISSLNNENKLISIEIKKSHCVIIPEIINDKIHFTLKIKEQGNIVEQQQEIDVVDKKTLYKLNTKQNLAIKKEITNVLNKIQKELNSDIVGFGAALASKYPQKWSEVKNDWPQIFPFIDWTLEIKTEIRNAGALAKPPKPSE